MNRKIFVVGGQKSYANWMQGNITNDFDKANLIVFTGGEDISPRLYGKKYHFTTRDNVNRDVYETEYYKRALKAGKHMIGICRGAQLMCAMNGGILIQDQSNPGFLHWMHTHDDKKLVTSSLHHQAAYPFDLPKEDYKVLAWTNQASKHHYGETDEDELKPPQECEVVWYPKSKCYGIQGHPEMIYQEKTEFQLQRTINYFQNQLNLFTNDKLA